MVRVREVVRERGLRQDWLARRMGVSDAHLSRLLRGERAWTEGTRAAVAEALGMGEEELFEGERDG